MVRRWAGADKFVLAGASYGGFIALDYAVQHGDRLLGLVLRDTWAHGIVGMMTALANIIRSDKVTVDVPRQIRVWTGTLRDDKDFEEAISELLPFYQPPENPSSKILAKDMPESTEFKGTVKFHSETQNAAFSMNMPRFDVRHQLEQIKVN
jgi:proline iminopeptidase